MITRAQEAACREILLVVAACEPFKDSGVDVEQLSRECVAKLPPLGLPSRDAKGTPDKRTPRDLALYAAWIVVLNQERGEFPMQGEGIGRLFSKWYIKAIYDATKRPPRRAGATLGADPAHEIREIEKYLAEVKALARRPPPARTTLLDTERAFASMAAFERPAFAKPKPSELIVEKPTFVAPDPVTEPALCAALKGESVIWKTDGAEATPMDLDTREGDPCPVDVAVDESMAIQREVG